MISVIYTLVSSNTGSTLLPGHVCPAVKDFFISAGLRFSVAFGIRKFDISKFRGPCSISAPDIREYGITQFFEVFHNVIPLFSILNHFLQNI